MSSDERPVVVQFFCDTVTEMARRQFVSGSPLRTLSLLLAGHPAEVFAASSLQSGSPMGGGGAQSRVSGHSCHVASDIRPPWVGRATSKKDGERISVFSDDCGSLIALESSFVSGGLRILVGGRRACPFVGVWMDWRWIVIVG